MLEEVELKIKDACDTFTLAVRALSIRFADESIDLKHNQNQIAELIKSHADTASLINNAIITLNDEYNLFEDDNVCNNFTATIVSFLQPSFGFLDLIKIFNEKTGQNVALSIGLFTIIQNFINTFSSSEKIKEYKKQFADRGIDINGFNSKIQRPMAQENRKNIISIVIGTVVTAVVIAVYFFTPDKTQSEGFSTVLRILLALGVAGLSAGIIGSLTIKTTHTLGLSATGGMAIFVLIYFYNPVGHNRENFNTTVFLKDNKNENIYSDELGLKLKLNDDYIAGNMLTSNMGYLFKTISETFKSKPVELYLKSDKWVFKNLTKTTTVTLEENSLSVPVVRDSTSLIITGNVGSADEPLANVKILVDEFPEITAKSDESGNFSITLPKDFFGDEVKIHFSLPNYINKQELFKINKFQRIILAPKEKVLLPTYG
ncbi:hypothetical protein EZ428_02735 [Pedobacter frigiditerrae]|uniref:Uncharacterized protein n=1 Tax=Pedobacter frigiditerrae TaxID=2530452 RepID=A0A4R0N617_9SPHI|nr:hypothetical protein [Pedobacter frigiditerrae]TCC93704.1 hypothetical protein EZ428_02735 [Pedobacter frigiditerrae]